MAVVCALDLHKSLCKCKSIYIYFSVLVTRKWVKLWDAANNPCHTINLKFYKIYYYLDYYYSYIPLLYFFNRIIRS